MFPVPTDVPPQLPVIHRSVVPEPPDAVSVALDPAHIGPLLLADVGATGSGFTVNVAAFEVALPQALETTQV